MPSTGNKIGKEICDVLGLKHVRRLDLHLAVSEIAAITVEMFPEENGIKQLVPIMKKYKLINDPLEL